METTLFLLAASTVIVIAAITIPLAIFTTGIRRQERCGSLAVRPRGLSASLRSWVVNLHGQPTRPVSARHEGRRA